MLIRSTTISIPSPGGRMSGCGDVKRALAAGFSPAEVRYMLALDIPATTAVELDNDMQVPDRSKSSSTLTP